MSVSTSNILFLPEMGWADDAGGRDAVRRRTNAGAQESSRNGREIFGGPASRTLPTEHSDKVDAKIYRKRSKITPRFLKQILLIPPLILSSSIVELPWSILEQELPGLRTIAANALPPSNRRPLATHTKNQ